MQNPNNLQVYGRAFDLAEAVYRATSGFPPEERYGITAQMRRAAISVGSCIAEGCGRSGDKELANYLHMSLGSATELEFQAKLSVRLGFGDRAFLTNLLELIEEEKRMLSRLIVSITDKKPRKRPPPSGGPSDSR